MAFAEHPRERRLVDSVYRAHEGHAYAIWYVHLYCAVYGHEYRRPIAVQCCTGRATMIAVRALHMTYIRSIHTSRAYIIDLVESSTKLNVTTYSVGDDGRA